MLRLLKEILEALKAILAQEKLQTAEEVKQTDILQQIQKSTSPGPAVAFVPVVGSPISK